MMKLDEATLLREFNRLVDEGVVLYSDDQKLIQHTDGDLKFRFLLSTALAKKPLIPGSGPADLDAKTESRLLPGSDISTTGFELGHVNGTHLVIMNKFCYVKPHLLLLTKDGYRRQHEALDREDFDAAWTTLKAVGEDADYMVFFNCGPNGGCSRLHKHIQIIPYPKENFAAFLDRPEGKEQETDVPFVWFYRRFDNNNKDAITPNGLHSMYEDLLEQGTKAAGYRPEDNIDAPPEAACPHNVVLTKRWMLVFPRRKAKSGEAATNSLGMLGILMVSKQSELDSWVEQGPWNLLRDFGVPR